MLKNIFEVAQQDQSLLYLGQLFGDVGGILPSAVGQLQLLGTMFTTINTMVLVLASFILVYVLIMGLLKTATQGEALGKEWSTLWVPIRSVVGIASLMPTTTGYSLIQVAIMWVVIQGIGAADMLWGTVLSFINFAGSPYSSVSIAPPRTTVAQNLGLLFQSLTCQETTRMRAPNTFDGDSPYYMISVKDDGTFRNTVSKAASDSIQLITNYTDIMPFSFRYIDIRTSWGSISLPIQTSYAVAKDGMVTYSMGINGGGCGQMSYPDPTAPDYFGICQASDSDSRKRCRTDLQSAVKNCKSFCPQATAICSDSALNSDAAAACSNAVVGCNTTDAVCLTSLHLYEEDNTSPCAYAKKYKASPTRDTLQAQIKCSAIEAQQKELSKKIVPLFVDVAQRLTALDQQYITFFENNSSKNPSHPQWIQDYCDDQGIPAEHCCVSSQRGAINHKIPTACTPTQLKAGLGQDGDTTCQDCGSEQKCPTTYSTSSSDNPCYSKDSGVFPYDYDRENDDRGNTSPDAVVKLYWPYGLQPQLQDEVGGDQSDFVNIATDEFMAALDSANQAVQTQVIQEMKAKPLQDWMSTAQPLGWIFAGAYYYNMAGQRGNNINAAMPTMTMSGSPAGNPLRNNYLTAQNIINAVAQSQSGNPNPPPLVAAQASSSLDDTNSRTISNFENLLTSGANPIIGVMNEGQSLMVGAETLALVYFPVVGTIQLIVAIMVMALGNGPTINPAKDAIAELFSGMNMGVLALCAWLMTVGGVLGVYVPLIPYTLFTMGAIGWFFVVIEAIVAGPFIGLAILSPGGHEIFGHAQRGLMMLLNVFLRPSMMVLGMMLSMLLAPIAVGLINAGFASIVSSINKSPGPVEAFLFLTLYTALIVAVLSKMFTLIYVIPNKALSWIGGGGDSGQGESETLGEMKGNVDSAVAKIESGAAGAIAQASQAHSGMVEKIYEVNEVRNALAAQEAKSEEEKADMVEEKTKVEAVKEKAKEKKGAIKKKITEAKDEIEKLEAQNELEDAELEEAEEIAAIHTVHKKKQTGIRRAAERKKKLEAAMKNLDTSGGTDT
jgi:hypothetical protein